LIRPDLKAIYRAETAEAARGSEFLSRQSPEPNRLMRFGRANPSASGQIWMIRRFTSAQFVPADAGSKAKNPMGSALLSSPIIAPTNLDRHQILHNFCHESVRKGLNKC
jgi:hypothetical protein